MFPCSPKNIFNTPCSPIMSLFPLKTMFPGLYTLTPLFPKPLLGPHKLLAFGEALCRRQKLHLYGTSEGTLLYGTLIFTRSACTVHKVQRTAPALCCLLQTAWTQIRTNRLWGLIRIQILIIQKSQQMTTKALKLPSMQRY